MRSSLKNALSIRDSIRGGGKDLASSLQTLLDKGIGAVGVVHVAATMMEVEDLVSLRDGGEQWVVASQPFLLLVETHRRAFAMALGAEHRAVEIQSDSSAVLSGEAVEDEAAVDAAQSMDAGGVGAGQTAADGGDVGEAVQSQRSFDHLIVAVVLDIAQVTKAEKSVNDEQQDDEVMFVGGMSCEVAKAVSELFLECEEDEQSLEHDESGEQCEWLFVELYVESLRGFPLHVFSATFHGGGFL